MRSSSFARHGRSRDRAEAVMLEREAAERQAAVVAANRERLRMDAPAVDPTLLGGAQAVFVRGSGWWFVTRVNNATVTVSLWPHVAPSMRVPFSQIVDYR